MDSPPPSLADISAALPALPLFPLPQTVLFPDAMLPLHIFEPRYRAMIRDVLATHRTLAVVLITDPSMVDAHGHPQIAGVAGVGIIVDHADLPGGRYNVLLRGRARVRLEELPFVSPYRRARATVLPSEAADVTPSALSALLSTATSFASIVRERDKSFELRLPRDASAGTIADLCAHQLVLDVRERQSALETLDVAERVRRVTDALAIQRLTLAPERGTLN